MMNSVSSIHRIDLLCMAISVWCVSCLSGCGLPDYSYNSIQKEYIGRVSELPADLERRVIAEDDSIPVRDGKFPLTLQDAIDTALHNNPNLMGAVRRIEQSRAMLTLARSGFLPQLSFYTEYMQGDAPSAYLFKKIDQRRFPSQVNFNEPGWFENFESGLKAQINLFSGGSDYLSVLMARRDIEISRLDRMRIENDMTAQVIQAFYDTLAAQDFIQVAEESVFTFTEQLRIMRVRFAGGAVIKSDVLSMEVRLAEAREQLVSSRNRFHLAQAALANLMGLEPSALTGKDDALDTREVDLPAIPGEYEQGIVIALNHRPELSQVRNQLIKSRMSLTSAKAAYQPRLDLFAKYYVDDPGMEYETNRENWTVAFLLNWDLFTGFSRQANVSRAEAVVQELLTADRVTLLGITLDVKSAYLNLEEAGTRYQVAKSSVESAEESFRLVREHFQGGAANITRYLEVELDYNRARIRATAARYDTIKGLAEVARSLGLWTERQEISLSH